MNKLYKLDLKSFLLQKEEDIKENDDLWFFELSKRNLSKLGVWTLLVQWARWSWKSTFLKYLCWQKKNETKKDDDRFICIHFTPRYFNSNKFYESFMEVLKNKLIQKKYCAELSNELDDLLRVLNVTEWFWYKMLWGVLWNKSNKSIESIISSISDIISKSYSEYTIMIVVDEIDRLHVNDLIEVGKLLEFIKILDSRSLNISTVFARDSSYLARIVIPWSISKKICDNEKKKWKIFSFEEYFRRFRDNSIDLYWESKDELFSFYWREILLLRWALWWVEESDKIKRLLDTVSNLLSKKWILFTIRTINRIIESLKSKLKFDVVGFEEVPNYQALNLEVVKRIIYFEHVFYDSVDWYTDLMNVILDNKYKYSNILSDEIDDEYKKNINTSFCCLLQESDLESIIEYWDLIDKIIRNWDYKEFIISSKKQLYIKNHILNEVKQKKFSDAKLAFAKYYRLNQLSFDNIDFTYKWVSFEDNVLRIEELFKLDEVVFENWKWHVKDLLRLGSLIKAVFNVDSEKKEAENPLEDVLYKLVNSEKVPMIFKLFAFMRFRWSTWAIEKWNNSFIEKSKSLYNWDIEYDSLQYSLVKNKWNKWSNWYAYYALKTLLKWCELQRREDSLLLWDYLKKEIKKYSSMNAYIWNNSRDQYIFAIYRHMIFIINLFDVWVGNEGPFNGIDEFLEEFSVRDKVWMLAVSVNLNDKWEYVYNNWGKSSVSKFILNSINKNEFIFYEDIAIMKNKSDYILEKEDFNEFKKLIYTKI